MSVRSRAVAAQTRAEVLLTARRGESVIATIAIPLGVLVFFAKVDRTVPAGYRHAVDFLVPGVLALAVMSAAMVSLGIATGFDRRYGVLKRLGATPLTRGGLLAAKTATVLVTEVVQTATIVAVGVALGWPLRAGLVAATALILLGTVAFAGIGLLLAGTLRAEANLAISNGLFLVLLFLGGMAYPLERLPTLLRDVAHLLPAAALSECLRGVLDSGRAFPGDSLIVLAVWAIGAPLLAARTFTFEE